MEESQVQALIDAALAKQAVDFEKMVGDILEPTMKTFMEDVKKSVDVKPEQKPAKAETALEQRIRVLEEQLTKAEEARIAQEKASASLRFDQELSQQLDGANPLHKSVVKELLSNRLKAEAVETDGKWLVNGKTLQESTKAFFETPEGQHFLPSQHQNGAGVSEAKPNKTTGNTSLAAELMSAFL